MLMMKFELCAGCGYYFRAKDTQYHCGLFGHTDILCESCNAEVELFIEKHGNRDEKKMFVHD